jgi:UPF0716 protein FxsA
MIRRLFVIYALAELAAVIALVATVGWGWTLLTLLGTFILGILLWAPMAGWQLTDQIVQLRSGLKDPRSALGDSAMVSLAAILVLLPGLVTTILGLLLLVPPIRAAARPRLAAIAGRRFGSLPLITDMRRRPGRDYIEGEVIDVHDVEQPALPPHRV